MTKIKSPPRVETKGPAISVAMSVYDGEKYLALAIESILAQTFSDFEFLILNDGSKDGSAAIIDAYAAQDGRIRAIHRENKGLIASLNELLQEARAPIIARMDCDDIALTSRFEKQIAFLESNPDYGVVGCWTSDIDEKGDTFFIEGADHPIDHQGFLASIEGGPTICHPAAMMRRDLVIAVGGYHAAFKHCEDFDLWLRLASKTKLCSIPERLMQYRHTEGQISNRHIVEQQIGAAASRLAWRERQAGRIDPTEHLTVLPPMEDFDRLFGREGMTKELRALTAAAILYSPVALKSDGFQIVLDQIRDGKPIAGLKRTILRLLRFRAPSRALSLALALITG